MSDSEEEETAVPSVASGGDGGAVVAKGVHTCMVMRGIKTDGVMTSSVMHGAFKKYGETRAEFLGLIK